MRTRPSLTVRLTRALVGLVTVWCLGCSSYEPLFQSLIGMNVGQMICGSDMGGMTATEPAASAVSDMSSIPLAITGQTDSHGIDCGCGGSCHAPSPMHAVRVARSTPVPTAAPSPVIELASVSRTPLLPPPEVSV